MVDGSKLRTIHFIYMPECKKRLTFIFLSVIFMIFLEVVKKTLRYCNLFSTTTMLGRLVPSVAQKAKSEAESESQ